MTNTTDHNDSTPIFAFRFASIELRDKLAAMAKASHRTMAGQINALIDEAKEDAK